MYTTAVAKLDHYSGATYIPAMGNAAAMANGEDDKYIVTTKIMVLALSVLFAVVFFVVCLHIYAKWMWGASAPGSRAPVSFWLWWRRGANSASESVLDADTMDINLVVGLGKAAVEALPMFRYKTTAETAGGMECAICLGQFQEGELGRALPKCGHSFHLECIDMWLFSHSTCPLCRAVLEPDEDDDSISLNLESSSIQVFHMSAPISRRLQSPRDVLQPPPAPEPQQPDEQETNKRADSIPANVLFWGNLMPHAGANSRVVNNAIAIDIDTPTARSHHAVSAPGSFSSF